MFPKPGLPGRSVPSALLAAVVAVAAVLATAPAAEAQYFGRNKVRYDAFEFKVLETEHFDLYYYEGLEQGARDVARMAERWYERLSDVLNHEFDERKPIVLYADDADFRQTNIANIGEGTQGVTEGLRQRVVLPMASTYAETDHVLGHELVHQFQYDIAQTSGSFQQFVRLPLFLIEGLAEYLSVGREDALTAMWMRDAVLRDDFPTLSQLQSGGGRYNEYQYGQPFWAYVGGTYGDEAAVRLFKTALQMPIDSAVVTVTGLHPDSLSRRWEASLREGLVPAAAGRAVPSPPRTEAELEQIAEERADRAEARLDGKTPKPPRFLAYPDSLPRLAAQRLLARERDTGSINIAPQLSPDGRTVAYLSERDLFGIDLYLADAASGEVISKLESVGTNPHFDALRFIESAGAWRPDGAQFAYVVFAGGDNEIAILDVDRRNVVQRLDVRSLGAIKDPTWSPDGTQIAFTGVKGGIADLYVVDVAEGTVRQLTNDRFADLQAAWSPDGRTLAFATDRGPGTDFDRLTFSPMRLGLYDLETGQIEVLSLFPGRKHINPAWSPDGASLYFISDQAGFNDVYRLDLATRELFQVTNLATGVSGISDLSPALSVADATGALAYSVFEGQRYSVYQTPAADAVGTPVAPALTEAERRADVLPPSDALTRSRVTGYLADAGDGLPPVTAAFAERPYRSRLSLDYISQPSVGATYDPYYGSGLGVAGGVQLFFSDQLSDNVLGLTVQANGTFKDVGGQALYIDRGGRLNYGALVGHVPYLQSYLGPLPESSGLGGAGTRYFYRTYVSQARGIAAYPLNQSQRVEVESGYTRYGYDLEFDSFVVNPDVAGGVEYQGRRPVEGFDEDPRSNPLHLGSGGAAFVGDYSYFGLASPIRGGRYRFGVDGTAGSLNYATVTADYRRYVFTRPGLPRNTPLILAARALHFGRYGSDASSGRLNPLFLGYGSLVRGYGSASFSDAGYSAFQDRLFGSKIGLASVEARLPLLGVPQFGLVTFPYLPTELTLFADAGLAWGGIQRFSLLGPTGESAGELTIGTPFGEARPVVSAGVSARINILGALIVEPYYAFPLSRYGAEGDLETGRGVFGFNFTPGW